MNFSENNMAVYKWRTMYDFRNAYDSRTQERWKTLISQKNGESFLIWCGWRDLNPHALRRQNLNLVRLPISPHPQSIEVQSSGSLAKENLSCESKIDLFIFFVFY